MQIVSFVHEGLGNSSYFLEIAEGQAILVDPDRSVDRYLEASTALEWRISAVIETHLHADFVSGSRDIADVTGAPVHLPAEAGAGFPHRGVVPGERLRIGEVEIEAIPSPGHTPEHLSYLIRGEGEVPVLFAGGALIVGGAARTDLIDPSLTDELTRAQFRTLRDAFVDLPDETVLFPTHGGGSFCSVGSADGRRSSTLGEERKSNPLLDHQDEDEFARWFPSTFPSAPAYFFRLREVNRAGPRLRREVPLPFALSPEEFDRRRVAGAMVIDVRPFVQYSAAHIPDAVSIPFREAYATWLGWLVPQEAPLLFVTDGASIDGVVEESMLVGYEELAGYLNGGMEAWGAVNPVRRTGVVDVAGAHRAFDEGALALDVREPSEFERGHIEGALHVPLGALAERVGELPANRPIVAYCSVGNRGSSALSILERAGFERLLNLAGGFGAWKKATPDRSA